jgi:hypothetical protein
VAERHGLDELASSGVSTRGGASRANATTWARYAAIGTASPRATSRNNWPRRAGLFFGGSARLRRRASCGDPSSRPPPAPLVGRRRHRPQNVMPLLEPCPLLSVPRRGDFSLSDCLPARRADLHPDDHLLPTRRLGNARLHRRKPVEHDGTELIVREAVRREHRLGIPGRMSSKHPERAPLLVGQSGPS